MNLEFISPDAQIIAECCLRIQRMQAELQTLKLEHRDSDYRALESAIAKLKAVIRRNVQ